MNCEYCDRISSCHYSRDSLYLLNCYRKSDRHCKKANMIFLAIVFFDNVMKKNVIVKSHFLLKAVLSLTVLFVLQLTHKLSSFLKTTVNFHNAVPEYFRIILIEKPKYDLIYPPPPLIFDKHF